MKFVFYTNSVSPHQLPLACELLKVFGENGYRYIYTTPLPEERRRLGWTMQTEEWIIAEFEEPDKARRILEDADIVMMSVRDWRLVELRSKKGLLSIYTTERWCKPPIGMMRFLFPSHIRHILCLSRFLQNFSNVLFFPTGIHSARDMARLCGLVHGDLKCLFKAPDLDFEKKPGGHIWLKNGGDGRKYCLDKMRMWGYYVEPSKFDALPVQEVSKANPHEIKVLWVGRLLNWKRVDTIVRAVVEHANFKRVDDSLPNITLDIYGTGPEETRLRKQASKYGDIIKFYPPVPIDEVRKLMREHDVYVLASDAYEGWGAVVSEALEEGIRVIGTREAGSSATMLPDECLFHSGDWRTLAKMLSASVTSVSIGGWNAAYAAQQIMDIYDACKKKIA